MSEPIWAALVDWDADGDWGDAYEDVSADLVAVGFSGGRSAAADDFAAGRCSLTLENPSGRYSRYNASSPLYGLLLPGRELVLSATHNGTAYPGFRGELVDVREQRTVDGVPAVQMTFLDGFERLRRGSVSLPLQDGKRVDEVLRAICDAAGWPVARRAFDVALTTLERYWCHRKAPLQALQEAAKQELGGQLYCDRSGVLRFENRDNRTLQPLYATVSDAAGLELSFRRDDLVSDVSFSRAGLDVASGLSVLYSLSPTGRPLAPGSDSPLNRLSGEYQVGGTNVLAPVAGVDYLANSQPDGSGADKTSQLVLLSFTSYGGGFSAGFENLDTAPIYLTLLQVRGQAVRRSNDERRIDVAAPAPLVEGQVLRQDFDFNDDAETIRAFARWRAATLSVDQPRPTVDLLGSTDAEIATILGTEVSKRVRLVDTAGLYPSQIDGLFY
ncbi:MAG TPA: hypothetical protein PKA95_08285, partial [Thermomicrobiales bacterium]|nr:hypothetical protein [Thermomicrobiales bacterium]